jgi:hypothetical protein
VARRLLPKAALGRASDHNRAQALLIAEYSRRESGGYSRRNPHTCITRAALAALKPLNEGGSIQSAECFGIYVCCMAATTEGHTGNMSPVRDGTKEHGRDAAGVHTVLEDRPTV